MRMPHNVMLSNLLHTLANLSNLLCHLHESFNYLWQIQVALWPFLPWVWGLHDAKVSILTHLLHDALSYSYQREIAAKCCDRAHPTLPILPRSPKVGCSTLQVEHCDQRHPSPVFEQDSRHRSFGRQWTRGEPTGSYPTLQESIACLLRAVQD